MFCSPSLSFFPEKYTSTSSGLQSKLVYEISDLCDSQKSIMISLITCVFVISMISYNFQWFSTISLIPPFSSNFYCFSDFCRLFSIFCNIRAFSILFWLFSIFMVWFFVIYVISVTCDFAWFLQFFVISHEFYDFSWFFCVFFLFLWFLWFFMA